MYFYSCPGGQNNSQPCPEGFYNDNTGQSDIGACQVILPNFKVCCLDSLTRDVACHYILY